MEVQQYWVTVSYGHPGSFHAVLCLSALQLAIAQPASSALYLERFIHHRLASWPPSKPTSRLPCRAPSSENIATVFHLLCIEDNFLLHGLDALAACPMWTRLQPEPAQRAAILSPRAAR